jgi:hypothetical protein
MPEEVAISAKALNLDKVLQVEKREFLKAFAAVGVLTWAAERAGVCRDCHYKWLKNDPNYVEAYLQAEDMAKDALEAEAHRRAVHGTEERELTIEEQHDKDGKSTGRTRKLKTTSRLSDTLLIFLLKGARPAKFRERYEFSGPGGGPIQVEDLHYHLVFDRPPAGGPVVLAAPPMLTTGNQDTSTPNNNGGGNGHDHPGGNGIANADGI